MAAEQLVYVVDDDAAVRESLGALLEARSYTVRSFEADPSARAP